MTGHLDTNVLVRLFTNDPPDQALRARALLAHGSELLVTDVVFAECAFVLRRVCGASRAEIARALRAIVEFPAITVSDPAVLTRAAVLFEHHGLRFAEAHLVARAESDGRAVASFDRDLRKAPWIEWIEP